MIALWVATSVAGAASLPEAVAQQYRTTGQPVLLCTVGPDAADAARRALAGVPKKAKNWQPLPLVGDPERELERVFERTGETCALRLTLADAPGAELGVDAVGDCGPVLQAAETAVVPQPVAPAAQPPPPDAPEAAAAHGPAAAETVHVEGLFEADDQGVLMGVGLGYHHFTWFGSPVGPGVALEGVWGKRGPRGGLQGRAAVVRGRSPEGVSLRKADLGIRYELPSGPVRVQLEAGLGGMAFEGATGQRFRSGNLSFGLGVAVEVEESARSRLLIGPRIFIDTAASDAMMPITGLGLFIQPSLLVRSD